MITEQDVLCGVERRSRIYCPSKRQARQDIYVRWVESEIWRQGGVNGQLSLVEWKSWRCEKKCGLGALWQGLGRCIPDELQLSNVKRLQIRSTYNWQVLFRFLPEPPLLHSVATAYPSWLQAKAWVHPWPVATLSQGHIQREKTTMRTHTRGQIGVSISYHINVWEEGRVPGENLTLPTERAPGPWGQRKWNETIYILYIAIIT